MSSEKWAEPSSQGETGARGIQGGQQASGDNQQQAKEDPEVAEEKEYDGYSASKTEDVTPGPGVGEKQQEQAETLPLGKQRSAQERSREQVIQADGGVPDICLGDRYLSGGRKFVLRQQRGGALTQNSEKDRDKRLEDPRGPGPFFFFGGGNGASIVTSYCESRGWQRIYDKTREDFTLKWCETKSPATYYNFRAGEQLLYQIPNNKVLTTKIGLLSSLREYERICSKVNQGRGRRMKMEEFFPATFRMDVRHEKEAFFAQQEGVCDDETSVWICKPTGLNQGRGIFLLRTQDDITAFRARLQNVADSQSYRKLPFRLPQARIVQRYVQNPLLLNGRKFDVRSFFLIACTSPFVVFFRHGYVRLTCDLYDPNSNNLSAHLTNQYMQKKNPLYSVLKEDTVWSMERFNAYVNEKFMVPKGLPKDWVLGAFAKRMKQIMTQSFLAVKAKLERKLGYFDLIGCDFMIDEDFKVWLLEMNCNPALHTNCQVLKEAVPSTVMEALDVTLEIFNKCRSGLKLLPLSSQRDFVLLYDGDAKQRSQTPCPPKSPSALKNSSRTRRAAATVTAGHKAGSGSPVPPVTSDASAAPAVPPAAAGSPPAPHADPPAPPLSHLPSGTTPTQRTPVAKVSEPGRACPRPPRPVRVRVELRLSKCTWQSPPPNPDLGAPRGPGRVGGTVMSLSTPALTEGSRPSARRLRARPSQAERKEGFCCFTKQSTFRLPQPRSCRPGWSEKQTPEPGAQAQQRPTRGTEPWGV